MDEQQPGNVISPRSQDSAQSPQEVTLQIPREQPSVSQNTTLGPVPAPQIPISSVEIPQVTPELTPSIVLPVQQPSPSLLPPQQVDATEFSSFAPPVIPENTPVEPQTLFTPSTDDAHVSWTASEFIDHAKSLNWYLIVGIVGVIGSIGVYFWTKDIVSTAAIAVVAILFAVSAARKPRVLPYTVDEAGIQIGPKHYAFAEFKTFSLIHDSSAFSSIHLLPLKRFAPPVSMYFPPDEEDAIATALSMYLPYEERKADATDRLLKKLRF